MTTNTIDAVRLECPCGKRGKVPASHAGRTIRCKRCKNKLRVPGATQEFTRAKPPRPAEDEAPSLRRDRTTEAHVAAIAVWSFVGGGLVLAFLALSALSEPRLLLSPPFLFMLAACGLSLATSVGLRRLSDWACYLTVTTHALSLLWAAYLLVPVLPHLKSIGLYPILKLLMTSGLSVAILLTFVLSARDLFTDEYRAEVKRTGLETGIGSPFMYAPLVIGFIGILSSL